MTGFFFIVEAEQRERVREDVWEEYCKEGKVRSPDIPTVHSESFMFTSPDIIFTEGRNQSRNTEPAGSDRVVVSFRGSILTWCLKGMVMW